MSVSLKISDSYFEIGSGNFLFCFLSTISGNLEPNGWGSRFPVIIGDLEKGEIAPSQNSQATNELRKIQEELKNLNPDKVIWDINDRSLSPPWGNQISSDITDLSNYFVTSGGRDLFEVLLEALEQQRQTQQLLQVV